MISKQSFRDSQTGVLKAYGYYTTNQAGDISQSELESFSLKPQDGWQWNDSAWVSYKKPVTTEDLISANEIAIQSALDTKAQSRGYSNIKSACAYASVTPAVTSTDDHFAVCERFRKEGNALQAWMSLTWATAYAYIATVQSGTNLMPTPEQAVAMIPAFTWPD